MIPRDAIPGDPMLLDPLDDTVPNPFANAETSTQYKVFCAPCLSIEWLFGRYVWARVLLFFIYIPYALVVLLAHGVVSLSNASTDFFCAPPRMTVDADLARKYGLTLDSKGQVIARAKPIRPLTQMWLYVRLSLQLYMFLVLLYLVGLAAREIGATEAYIHNAYIKQTTRILPPPQGF